MRITDKMRLDWMTKNPDDIFYSRSHRKPWELGKQPLDSAHKTLRAAIDAAIRAERQARRGKGKK